MQKTEFEIEKNLNNIKFEIKVKKNEQDFFHTFRKKNNDCIEKNEHVKKIH